jgi:molybdate-binding protein
MDKFTFTSKNLSTVLTIQSLVESLGLKTSIKFKKSINSHSLLFRSKIQLVNNQRPSNVRLHLARRYIKEITDVPPQMCVYIETTSKDSTILVGEGFIACR